MEDTESKTNIEKIEAPLRHYCPLCAGVVNVGTPDSVYFGGKWLHLGCEQEIKASR